MASVTKRIQDIKPPYGGSLPVRNMKKTQYYKEYALCILDADIILHFHFRFSDGGTCL